MQCSVCAPCLPGMKMEAKWPCPQCQQQQQPQLPDKVWLRVFALLDARTLLLAVRPTCRRWSALALDPSVWEGVDLDELTPLPLLLAACRTAPRAGLLGVHLHELGWSALTQLATTPCAASALALHGCTLVSMMWAAKILQNQLARGRIRALVLQVELRGGDAHLQLVQLLTGTERLAGMKLAIRDEMRNGEGAAAPSSSGLPDAAPLPIWNLQYTGATPAPVLRWLLAASAGSLQRLELWEASRYHSAPPLAELAECRRVREAYLPAAVIEAIPPGSWGELEDLELDCNAATASDALRLACIDFFSCAPQLEKLGFHAHGDDSDAADVAQDLTVLSVAALSSRPEEAPPSLRVLTVWLGEIDMYSWVALAGALPGLPALRRLELGSMPPPGFTAAISPRSAPRLAVLLLGTGTSESDLLAGRASAHLRELVQRYPAVHVLVQESRDGAPDSYTALCGHSSAHRDCDRAPLDEECSDYTLVRVAASYAALRY